MEIGIRLIDRQTLEAALELVLDVFMAFEAPDYSPEGVENFRRFIQPEQVAQRMDRGDMRLWGAWMGGELAGVIAGRGAAHISLLFVRPAFQRRGAARARVEVLCAEAAAQGAEAVTVNAAPCGVPAYERMGFEAVAPEQVQDGMRFTPMARRI